MNANRTKSLLSNTEKMFESRTSAGTTEKLQVWEKPHAKTVAWSYDMEGHAQKCVERYCERRNKVSSPCLDCHQFKKEELESVRELSDVCSQIVLKYLYLTRLGRPDIFWTFNKLAQSVTKWTRACDRRVTRLIAYIHHASNYKQYCHVGNTAQHCRFGLFQGSDFAGDFEDSNSRSGRRREGRGGGILCFFGSRTFVPISWMCKKQTPVYHSSTESEIISLDAGLRMDGLPALDLWDVMIELVSSSISTKSPINQAHCRKLSATKGSHRFFSKRVSVVHL